MKSQTHQSLELSLVIPFYNEQESLKELYNRIIDTIGDRNYEIIFIDDGSLDESARVVDDLVYKNPRVKLIQFQRNFGKAAALAAGFRACKGNVVVTMDSDLQDDPREIPNLIDKLDSGYDLVSGWKKIRHDPLSKRLASKVYNFFTSLMSGIWLHDFNCGLKAYRKEVVKTIQVYGDLHRYLPVLAHHSGFRVTELPVKHHPRQFGKSTARFTRGAFDLITITFLTRYRKRPLHLFGLVGMISALLGMIVLLILTYQRLVLNIYLSNRPILFLGVLLIIVGIQFFSMGLLGEMVTSHRESSDAYLIKRVNGIDLDF